MAGGVFIVRLKIQYLPPCISFAKVLDGLLRSLSFDPFLSNRALPKLYLARAARSRLRVWTAACCQASAAPPDRPCDRALALLRASVALESASRALYNSATDHSPFDGRPDCLLPPADGQNCRTAMSKKQHSRQHKNRLSFISLLIHPSLIISVKASARKIWNFSSYSITATSSVLFFRLATRSS